MVLPIKLRFLKTLDVAFTALRLTTGFPLSFKNFVKTVLLLFGKIRRRFLTGSSFSEPEDELSLSSLSILSRSDNFCA